MTTKSAFTQIIHRAFRYAIVSLQKLRAKGDNYQMPGDVEFSFSPKRESGLAAVAKVKAIAFYLPQFHAIPENDNWWGKGFTEWTNTRNAKPLFPGHDQPRIPHPDLGYYDLTDITVMEKQAEMAKEAGIYGFCHYYYWFNGKRLLETPLENMLKTGRPDMPFCYCWANENWTRAWDGKETEVLIKQDYKREYYPLLVHDLARAFRDERYIRISGKPVFVIYRPMRIPDAKNVIRYWRELFREEGIGEVYLVGVRAERLDDPRPLGLDALIDFPPRKRRGKYKHISTDSLKIHPFFNGKIHDYLEARYEFVTREKIGNNSEFRGVMLAWDNTARRKERARIFTNFTQGAYYNWLKALVEWTLLNNKEEEQFIFIFAWNEWAEGCYLEPDEKNAYSLLNATRTALCGES